MTNKPLLLLLLIFLLPASLEAKDNCSPYIETEYVPITERNSKSLFYLARKCGQPPIYIFGTYHSDSPKLDPILKRASELIAESDRLGIEIVVTPEQQREARKTFLLHPSHTGLKYMLGSKRFKEVAEKVGPILGITVDQVDRYKPWALAVLVQYPKSEGNGIVIDEKLQRLAESQGKKVIGLEKIEDQLGIFNDMPEKEQIEFLELTLEDMQKLTDEQEELKNYYLSQDLPGIYKMSERVFGDMAKEAPKSADYLNQKLIIERNHTMVESMLDNVEGPTMFAVGALHLPGRNGILNLLEQEYDFMIDTLETTAKDESKPAQ